VCAGIASFDADPNPEMKVWLSSGGMHLLEPVAKAPCHQLGSGNRSTDGAAVDGNEYRRAQETLRPRAGNPRRASAHEFFWPARIFWLARKKNIGNFHPAVLEPYVLWNVEQLYQRNGPENARR